MGGGKNKKGIWHHRVPDFKLVYCGRDDDCQEKETKVSPIKKKKL
jgi:hypothetical protein